MLTMPVIKNQSAYGEVDVPLLRSVVDADAEVEVSEEQARLLLPQTDNWAPVDESAQTIADEIATVRDAEEHADDGPPAKNAPKAAWVGYAIAQGDADAELKTKEQLIAEHGETS